MKIACYSVKSYEKQSFVNVLEKEGFEIKCFQERLGLETAILSNSFDAVCLFVSDQANEQVLKILASYGIRLILLRCAGFDMVDLEAAKRLNIQVYRVPEYSPNAVAEHAMSLILSLNRKLHIAYHRTRDNNFSLEGLVGFDMIGKTVGILGMGKIGRAFAKICLGFGCHVLAYDVQTKQDVPQDVQFVDLKTLFQKSDILSLHAPLHASTKHVINSETIKEMKQNVILINTSRGGLVDTKAIIHAIKEKRIGAIGLDVYEDEHGVFFEDHSGEILKDDILSRLLTFPNVLVTGHQAYLTKEALNNIATCTLENIHAFQKKVFSASQLC